MEWLQEQDLEEKSNIKILVVDDREDNLLSIETILDKDGYTIVKANSGTSALKILLHRHDFSLILMDVQMPGMNGFETASIIYQREKLKDIPIIFITAHSFGEEYIFKGYKMGGVDYIYKPINPDLLKAKVSVFVELYRKNQQLLIHENKLLEINKFLKKEIEERKESEKQIRFLNKQLLDNNTRLKATNEDLDRFAYVASHDLQEPLRKIMIFSDKILKQNIVDEHFSLYFNKIIKSSQRMQALINDLLLFSRHSVEQGSFVAIHLNPLIKEVLVELEVEIEKTNAQITVQELPTVWGVPGLMRQVFYNILSNAIKFRRKDSTPVIAIYADKSSCSEINIKEVVLNGCDYYKIHVSDNGIGFDTKYAEDIFMVFKRLHSHDEYQGTGVGLSICKKIIEKHNGFITAISKTNEGSIFSIGLPEKNIHQGKEVN